ncbi:MAG: psp operon transcriptional activator [Moritella sp.]|jgi:psp operon transcriptional activator
MSKKDNMIGESDAFLSVLDQASRLAPLERPVLIIGERGTGKELIAKRVHFLSKRWEQPLVTLNCATLSEGLIDSELFGHEAGAFTGAKGRHSGRFERAENGSLFLDELANAPLRVQEKLLRVIEYGEYERVGGSTARHANVRLICATNEDLPKLAEAGQFRADLLDRLAFDIIHLPPLRQRREDIMPLAEYYAVRMCRELGFGYFAGFTPEACSALLSSSWPGNIRELKNVVERSIFRHNSEDKPVNDIIIDPFYVSWRDNNAAVDPEAVIASTLQANVDLPINLRQWQYSQEIALLEKALQQARFNQRHAAVLLGLSYHQLRGLLRKYQLVGGE